MPPGKWEIIIIYKSEIQGLTIWNDADADDNNNNIN